MYYFSYLFAVFYYKYFVFKHYFEAQAGYLVRKAVLWRPLAFIYWQFFQPVIWRVADLPAFAFADAFR
jgi:hypothetical protein